MAFGANQPDSVSLKPAIVDDTSPVGWEWGVGKGVVVGKPSAGPMETHSSRVLVLL